MFHNFLCKYSINGLPELEHDQADTPGSLNSKELGLIIDEHNNLIRDADLLKFNKKNKPLLVIGDNFEKEFKSIIDTIKFFETINIKLDRKTLYTRLKNGKLYKGYYFSYK